MTILPNPAKRVRDSSRTYRYANELSRYPLSRQSVTVQRDRA
jgi:hypothetical protein